MKILVTGASGFLGKDLVSELKNRKHDITEFSIDKGKDILNKKQVKEDLQNIDLVIHLAAILDNHNPKLWEVNVGGTTNLIEECARARVKKFILLSSTGVYGNTKASLNETSEVKPENLYEKSKYEAEQVVLNHQEELHVNVIRSAMILGPNMYWKNMFKILEKGFPLPCYGRNHFQVIYVKELIKAILQVMDSGEPGEIYLVAGKERWTLREFCKKTKGILGKPEIVWSVPALLLIILGKITRKKFISADNIRHLCKERKYDLEKINSIGYVQTIPMEEAIIETIEEIKEITANSD
ncbi:MAG: NAD-dependent epimerase/dehydratase family protein [archaeon]|jgi:nucleoside-diphosphate-sugar epimerase